MRNIEVGYKIRFFNWLGIYSIFFVLVYIWEVSGLGVLVK